ncbi:MAG: DUF2505 family protein [Deltaproteobacteria bacterium]|nr:DUF2505 family protein [Deltaproteobacteria bacterium]
MKTCTSSVVLPCSPERFWQIYLDDAFLRALYLDALQYKAFSIIEGGTESKKLHIVPKLNLPGPIAKLMGDSFAYEQHGRLDRAKSLWTWQMLPPAAHASKKQLVSTHGSIRIEAAGDGRCRRHDEVVIDAKVFGLGGMIEAAAEKETLAAQAKEVALIEQWAAKSHAA